MIRTKTGQWHLPILSLALAALMGCAQVTSVQKTFELREVQQQFNEAVQTDNTAAINPFAAGQNEALYSAVIEALSDNQISALDTRLQPNAWMLRAVSEWRTFRYSQALGSAQKGLASPGLVAQSRDQVLLTLIPALVIDSELRARLSTDDGELSDGDYNGSDGYRANFVTAVDKIAEAQALVGAATPASVVYYLEYHRWRVLSNWRFVISRLATTVERNAAQEAAKTFLKEESINDAAKEAANSIPDSDPLRQLIRQQGGAP